MNFMFKEYYVPKSAKKIQPLDNTESEAPDRLPVFPLPLFILPNGRQRLRIFEQKYLKMVSSASQGSGFIIAPQDAAKPKTLSSWGTRVTIVDFNISDDNILEIDVEGVQLVKLKDAMRQQDTLITSRFQNLPHWPELNAKTPNIMTSFLVQLFRENESIRTLYPAPDFENSQWTCARLLEMLPIPLEKKAEFTKPASFPSLVPFLNQIITGQ
jgi:hypothetical protein